MGSPGCLRARSPFARPGWPRDSRRDAGATVATALIHFWIAFLILCSAASIGWQFPLRKPQLMLSRWHALSIVFIATFALAQKPPIQITADLSEAPRKLFHAEIDLPVAAGPLALIIPKWSRGHHSPNGPVADITVVVVTANWKTLAWQRDDNYLYEVELKMLANDS